MSPTYTAFYQVPADTLHFNYSHTETCINTEKSRDPYNLKHTQDSLNLASMMGLSWEELALKYIKMCQMFETFCQPSVCCSFLLLYSN